MRDEEIYKKWSINFKDLRYLRPRRWDNLKAVIVEHKLSTVLEFGSGVSTLLFENLGLKVISYETNEKFLAKVRDLSTGTAEFIRWNNEPVPIHRQFDLSLVDGALPRFPQLLLSLAYSRFIAIDDFEKEEKQEYEPILRKFLRVDQQNTTLAIFDTWNHR